MTPEAFDLTHETDATLQLYPSGQGLLELVETGGHPRGDLGDVGVVLLGRGDEERAMAVEAGDMGGFVRSPRHRRHIAHPHHLARLRGDGDAADPVEVVKGAARLDAETAVARIHRSQGGFYTGRAQGVGHGGGRKLELAQAGEIQRHTGFGLRRAPIGGLANAADAVELVAQPVRHLLQPPIGQDFGGGILPLLRPPIGMQSTLGGNVVHLYQPHM